MKGQEEYLYNFMEGRRKRFVIPVYQRNYNWKTEHCKKLFNDLLSVHNDNKKSHFFGSIVSVNEDNRTYTVIDGQQRLTTVSLIMIAMINAVKNGKFTEEIDRKTCRRIEEDFIVADDDDVNKLRLRPYNDDKVAFSSLVFDTEDKYKEESNVTVNYRYFYNRIVNDNEISLTDLSDAIEKLQIISIELKPELGDDPQLIFESLNSTGLALTESDKIRNYILMGQSPEIQESLYKNYWYKVESLTKNKLDDYIFNYLMIHVGKVKSSEVYKEFKEYADNQDSETILENMLHYAELFSKIKKHDLGDTKSNKIIERIDRLGLTVADPFLMSYLDRHIKENQPNEEIRKVLLVLESFLFRRIICGEPSNVLRNMFAGLHQRVLNLLKETTSSYSSVLIYLLQNIQASFPDDNKFVKDFGEKDIYHLKSHIRSYIFDRLERKDNDETINVFERLQRINLSKDEKPFSVEHVMPQTLTTAWVNDLGCSQIEALALQKKWLHTIANLTVTAYNSELSNSTFNQKKDLVFNEGSIRLNEFIRKQNVWTEKELIKRQKLLIDEAKELWKYPSTDFAPQIPLSQQITLDDDDYDFTHKKLDSVILLGFKYRQPYMEWAKTFTWIYQRLFELDPQPLFDLAEDPNEGYIVKNADNYNSKIAEGVYVYLNNNTNTKVRVLRNVVEKYPLNEGDVNDDIIFIMKASDAKTDN